MSLWNGLAAVSQWIERFLSIAIGALLAWRRSDSPAIRGLAAGLILPTAFGWYELPSGVVREHGVVWLIPLLEDIGARERSGLHSTCRRNVRCYRGESLQQRSWDSSVC